MKTTGLSTLLISTVAAVVLVSSCAFAATITLQPKVTNGDYHDAFISADNPDYSSPNWGQVARVNGSWNRRYIAQFDGLAPYIGTPVAVTSATLTIMFYYPPNTSGTPAETPSINVYRITDSWVKGGAGGATWNSRGGSLGNWTTAGGDYDPTPVATLAFPTPPGNYSWQSWDVTSLVSDWVAGTSVNNGLLLKWNDATDFAREWSFIGSGQGEGGQPPYLTFTTAPVPEPGSLLALASGILGLGGFVARKRRS